MFSLQFSTWEVKGQVIVQKIGVQSMQKAYIEDGVGVFLTKNNVTYVR